jgi:hypothetical protein
MIEQATKILSTKIVNPNVEWQNEYTPPNGVTHGDRVKFFTNYDKDLADRVSEIKQQTT